MLTACQPVQQVPKLVNPITNQKAPVTPSTIPTPIPLEAPSLSVDFIVDVETDYVKLEDINPKEVPEIACDMAMEANKTLVEKTKGGYLATHNKIKVVENTDQSEMTPNIVYLDESGKILWEKSYPYTTKTGTINHLLVLSDGSFIFSVQTYPSFSPDGEIQENSFLVKCDSDGNEVWKTDMEDYSGNMIQYLFLTKEEEIVAVGQCPTQKVELASSYIYPDDIVVTKLDQKGNLVNQKKFGGKEFESLYLATYDASIGIVISGVTQSIEGDFATENSGQTPIDFVACIDEELNVKWVFPCDEDEHLYYNQLIVSKACFYTLGNKYLESSEQPSATLIKLDKNGQLLLRKNQLFLGLWSTAMAVLKNGDLVIGAGQFNQGSITILNENGDEKERLGELGFAASYIYPTEDGGFIATAERIISPVAQPAYISSIWYDTELLVIKFNKDYEIEWQKTYDAYPKTLGFDFVKVFEDGSIMVEK